MPKKYEFKIKKEIENCSQCPCINYYPLEDEYICGVANIMIDEEELDQKPLHCPLREVIENAKE